MNAVVLDTTLVLFMVRNDPRLAWYRTDLEDKFWVVSFQTVAECWRGALVANWGERRQQRLEAVLSSCVVYPPTEPVMRAWGVLMNASRAAGFPLSSQDAWIAATAKALGVPLLTHDADFHALSCPGVQIVRYTQEGSS